MENFDDTNAHTESAAALNFNDLEHPAPATTNETKDSRVDLPGPPMPARVFFFWVIDEFGKDGKLVRKFYADERLAVEKLKEVFKNKPDQMPFEMLPEKYGVRARGPEFTSDPFAPAKHTLGDLPPHKSPYLSASELPEGAPNFKGRPVYIDKQKLLASGAKLVTVDEIVVTLKAYGEKHPHLKSRIETNINAVRNLEREVLIQPKGIIPPEVFMSPKMYARQAKIFDVGRGVSAVALVLTAYDLSSATTKSIEIKSIKPLAVESVRQIGGWGGAYMGAEIGAAVGLWIGGAGAVPGAFIGGIIGGLIGYSSAEGVADAISPH